MNITLEFIRQLKKLGKFAVFAGIMQPVAASAELACNPTGTNQIYSTESDNYFKESEAQWLKLTHNRGIESNSTNGCPQVEVIGYEGFPTVQCNYSDADAGSMDNVKPLAAKVILLNPSAKQLASWSIRACRVNGKDDSEMLSCIKNLYNFILKANGAQFPVVGSVVESFCNSGGAPKCNNPADRLPRNTMFRDGVGVDYTWGSTWTPEPHTDQLYSKLFDVAWSDSKLRSVFYYSRISNALREDWQRWRRHINMSAKPDEFEGNTFAIDKKDWRSVSALVHKKACAGEENELFNAVIFTNAWTRK